MDEICYEVRKVILHEKIRQFENVLQKSFSDLETTNVRQLYTVPYVSGIFEDLQSSGNLKNTGDTLLHLVFRIALAYRYTLEAIEIVKEKTFREQIENIKQELLAVLQVLHEISQGVGAKRLSRKIEDNLRTTLNNAISSYEKVRRHIARNLRDIAGRNEIQRVSNGMTITYLALLGMAESIRSGFFNLSIVPALSVLGVYLLGNRNSQNEETQHVWRSARERIIEAEKSVRVAIVDFETALVDRAISLKLEKEPLDRQNITLLR